MEAAQQYAKDWNEYRGLCEHVTKMFVVFSFDRRSALASGTLSPGLVDGAPFHEIINM